MLAGLCRDLAENDELQKTRLIHIHSNFIYSDRLSYLASDETQQYDKYYMSENGSDKSMCGKNADSACKSLTYVLGIYYNKSESPQPGLSIITSKSLIINQQLMVNLKSIQWLCYTYLIYLIISGEMSLRYKLFQVDYPKLVNSTVMFSSSESASTDLNIILYD